MATGLQIRVGSHLQDSCGASLHINAETKFPPLLKGQNIPQDHYPLTEGEGRCRQVRHLLQLGSHLLESVRQGLEDMKD